MTDKPPSLFALVEDPQIPPGTIEIHYPDGRRDQLIGSDLGACAVNLAVAMRAHQKGYFKNRSKENLIASKNAESRFDKFAEQFLELLAHEQAVKETAARADQAEGAA